MDRLKKMFSFFKRFDLNDQLGKYLKLLLIWCPLITILFVFGFGGHEHLIRRFFISYIIAATVASTCMAGFLLIDRVYSLYFKRRGQKAPKHSLLWGILTAYLFLVPGLYLGFNFAGRFSVVIGSEWKMPSFRDYSSGIVFGILVSGIFLLFEVMREAKEAKHAADLKFRILENEKLKAQISALTAQMNPHLLFNSLNTIASTISTDSKSAEDMVVQLSELYRGILKSAKGDMHSLESELLLCKSYLDIERRRFGSRIEYKIHIDEKVDPKKIIIPVLLLQPLVENAVKHGLTPKKEGGCVSIVLTKNESHFMIKVVDNGIGINGHNPSKGTGTGLPNCEVRIKLTYGEDSNFSFFRTENNETVVLIRIPLKEVICA